MADLTTHDAGCAAGRGLNLLTASEASLKLAAGETTAVDLVEDCLTRIEARDGEIRAWTYVAADAALAEARKRDGEPRRSLLHGIPVGIKDIFDTWDMPTAYGSSIYDGHHPATDTAIVTALRTAGAIILGKTLTTEFASPVPRGTRNPRDLSRSPGVSSSGSAAAVADCMVPLAVGSQTGGSTILPAAFCGVVGYKASLAGLDRGGIRHLRPSLDTLGLFARSTDDIALMRAALTETATEPPPPSVSGLRIGVCRTITWSQSQPESIAALEAATKSLAHAGATITDAEMPEDFEAIEETFRIISSFEGARALATEARDHLAKMNHWIQAGHTLARNIDADKYDKALCHAAKSRTALAGIFDCCDVILTPSTCGEAPPGLESVSNSAFNRIWTLMHVPCVTLPKYSGPAGMPVGVQIVGPIGSDARTIALATAIAAAL